MVCVGLDEAAEILLPMHNKTKEGMNKKLVYKEPIKLGNN